MRSILAIAASVLTGAIASANPPAAGCGCNAGAAMPAKHSAGLISIGQGCASPAGCSGLAADRTFLFGSCRQFFNAGSDCGFGRAYAAPSAPVSTCTYGSFHSR